MRQLLVDDEFGFRRKLTLDGVHTDWDGIELVWGRVRELEALWVTLI